MPIVLTLCLAILRELYQKPQLKLSMSMIVVMTIFYCIIFEGILPLIMDRYTFDTIDILLYLMGGFTFYIIQPKFRRK